MLNKLQTSSEESSADKAKKSNQFYTESEIDAEENFDRCTTSDDDFEEDFA